MPNFIKAYDNVFSEDFCNEVINSMEKSFSLGYGHSRQDAENVGKNIKEDDQIFPNQLVNASTVFSDDIHQEFNSKFWDVCYKDYANNFSVLNDLARHSVHGNKLQKTSVGGGYHVWHCEHGNKEHAGRVLAYIVYLNDVEEGGETEFLYQHKRFKPKQGTVVIWPAGFTHAHRGNPPLSNTKYIMTGWVEF